MKLLLFLFIFFLSLNGINVRAASYCTGGISGDNTTISCPNSYLINSINATAGTFTTHPVTCSDISNACFTCASQSASSCLGYSSCVVTNPSTACASNPFGCILPFQWVWTYSCVQPASPTFSPPSGSMVYLSQGLTLRLPNSGGLLPQPTSSSSWTVAFYLGIAADNFSLPASIISESAGAWGIGLDSDMSVLIWLDRVAYDTNYILFRQAVAHAEPIPNIYHLALVYSTSGPSFTLFVNSISVFSKSVACQASAASTNSIQLANQLSGFATYDFDGYYDQLSLWNSALTSDQIYGLFNTSGSTPAASFSWPFDQSLTCTQSAAQNAVVDISGTTGLSYIDSPLFLFYNLDASQYGSSKVTINSISSVPLFYTIQTLARLNTRSVNLLSEIPTNAAISANVNLASSSFAYNYTSDSLPYNSPDCPFDIIPFKASDANGHSRSSGLYVASNRNYNFAAPLATSFVATLSEDYDNNVITLLPYDLDYLYAPNFGDPDQPTVVSYLAITSASFSVPYSDTGFAISFWFSPGITLPTASYSGYTILEFCTGSFSFTMSSTGVLTFSAPSFSLNTGSYVFNHHRWYHVQLTSASGNAKNLYVNGVVRGGPSATVISATTLSQPRIGAACSSPTSSYGMRLADLRVGPTAAHVTPTPPTFNPPFPMNLKDPATYSAGDLYLPLSSSTLPYAGSTTGLVTWRSFNIPSCRFSSTLRAKITSLPPANKGVLYQTSDGVTKGVAINSGDFVTDSQYRVIFDIASASHNVFGSSSFTSFTYQANDGLLTSAVDGTVTLNISNTPDAPSAANLTYTIPESTPLTITLSVSSPDASPLVAVLNVLPSRGSLFTNVGLTTLATAGMNVSSPYQLYFVGDQYLYGYPFTSFTYYALANTGLRSNLALVSINVSFVDDPPISASFNMVLGFASQLQFSTSCFDPDTQMPASVIFYSLPSSGVSIYTLDADPVADNTIYSDTSFTLRSGSTSGNNVTTFVFGCVSGSQYSVTNYTASITVLPFNVPPTAVNFTVSPNPSEGANVSVCLDGIDPDNLPSLIQFQIGALPLYGYLSSATGVVLQTGNLISNSSRCITFVPNPYTWGSVSFTYRSFDGQKYSSWGYVIIDITKDTSIPPIALPISVTTIEGIGSLQVQFLASDPNNPPGNGLTYTMPGPWSPSISGDTVTLTIPVNFFGVQNFTYHAFSTVDPTSASNILSVTVLNVNDPPVGSARTFGCTQTTPCSNTFISTFYYSPDSIPVQIIVVTPPIYGSLYLNAVLITDYPFEVPGSITSSSSVTLTYLSDSPNSDQYFVQVVDARGNLSTSTYKIRVAMTPVDQPPVASDAFYITGENTPIDFYMAVSDPDTPSFYLYLYDITWNTSLGVLSDANDCSTTVITGGYYDPTTLFYFCPALNYFTSTAQPIVIQFYAYDSNSGSYSLAPGNISIYVYSLPTAPSSQNVLVTMSEGALIPLNLSGSDPENPSELKSVIETIPPVSQLALYRDALETDPIAAGEFAGMTIYMRSITDAFANILNPVRLSFTYHVVDDEGLSSTSSRVNVTINLLDSPPVSNSAHYDFNQSSTNNPINLTGSDADSASFTYQLTSLPTLGTLSVCLSPPLFCSYTTANSGSLNTGSINPLVYYTPVAGQLGSVYTTFNFKTVDVESTSSTDATIEISIIPYNYPPVALPKNYNTLDTGVVYITLAAADDYTPLESLLFYVMSLPVYGTLVQADNQTLVTAGALVTAGQYLIYYPDITAVNHVDSFLFRAVDASGQTSSNAILSISITASNHAPVAFSSSVSVNNAASPFFFTFSASDFDSDPLTYTIVNLDFSTGTYSDPYTATTITSVPYTLFYNAINYNPGSFTGISLIRFQVSDSFLQSNIAIFSISVTGPDQPPSAPTISLNCQEDHALLIEFPPSDVDSPGSQVRNYITIIDTNGLLNLTVEGIPAAPALTSSYIDGGTASTPGPYDSQQLYFVPRQGFTGTYFLLYTPYSNSIPSTSSGLVSITVTPFNDPPVAYGGWTRMIEGQSPKINNTYSYLSIDIQGEDVDTPIANLTGCISSGLYDPLTGIVDTSGALGYLLQDDSVYGQPINPTDNCIPLTAQPLKVAYAAPPGGFLVANRPFAEFTYLISDGESISPNVTYRIFISQQPHNPTIFDQFIQIYEDTPYSWYPNISDVDFATNPPVAIISQLPVIGALAQNLLGVIDNGPINTVPTALTKNALYKPAPDASDYYDSWLWYAVDETGLNTSYANVTIYVIPVNDPPVAQDRNFQVILNRYVDIFLGYLASDVDSTSLTIQVLSVPTTGTLYQVFNTSDPYSSPILCCGGNCTDPANICDFTPIDITSPNGTLRFVPAPNATETLGAFAVVVWRVSDGLLWSENNATAQIDLVRNQPPTAFTFSVTTLEDQSIIVNLTGSDPEDDPTTANITGYPNRGTLLQFDGSPFILPSTNCSSCLFESQRVTDPNKRVIFVPAHFDASTNVTRGNETEVSVYTTFTFVFEDAELSSNFGLVTLFVIMLPYPPVSSNISITMREQDRKTLTLDAFSPNGEDLNYRLLALPTAGSTWQTLNSLNTVGFPLESNALPIFLISSSGSIIYESPANPTTTSHFYYFAYDALVLIRQNRSAIDKQSDVAYINIEVVPVNDPPIAFDQTITIMEDEIAIITLEGFDPDANADISPIIAEIPLSGSLYQYGNISDIDSLDRIITPFTDVNDPQWRLIFIPAQYDNGSPYTSFTFIFFDGEYDSADAYVTINVLPVNNAPLAQVPRSKRAYEGADLEIAVGGKDVDGGRIYAYVVNPQEPSLINSGSKLYQAVETHLQPERDVPLNFTARVTRGDLITENCTILTDPGNRLILSPLLAANNTLGRDTLTFVVQFSDGVLFSPNASISILVQKPKTALPASYDSTTGPIVGPVIAAIAAVVALALIVVIIWYRNNRMGDDEDYIKLDLFDSEEPEEPEMQLDEEPVVKPRGILENLILDPKYQVLNALLRAIDVTEYDALAKCLIDVFEYHNCTLEMLKYFITAEVDGATSAGTLFRANSIASKMMTAYTKMIGNEYLVVTLKTPIETIIKKDNAMEVDPKKLKQGESRKNNMRLLQLACQNFLDWIVSSASNAPMPIRILANHLFFSVERKFPANKHIAIGGFLFLRFFCPAIISPEGFKVIATPPPPPARRALVLIAKALQNLSNAVMFGKKEAYMVDLNEFISRNAEPLKTYFDSIVALPSQLPKVQSHEIPEERLADGLSVILRYLQDSQDKIFDILEGKDASHSERTDSHSTSRSGRSRGRGSSKGTSGRTSSHGSSKGRHSGSERSRSGSRLNQPHFGEDSVTEMTEESDLDSFDDGDIEIGDQIFVGNDGVEYILSPDEHFSDDDEVLFDEQTQLNAFSVEEVGTHTAREMGVNFDDWTNVEDLSLEEAWANALAPMDIKESTPDGFNSKGEVIDPILALKVVLAANKS